MKLTKPSLTKQNLWKWAVGLLVLGVVAYVGAIINEKRQFSQAEKQIGDVYSKIIDIAGEPDQEFKEKSCGYSSAKLSKGRLNCSVYRSILYENMNEAEANDLINELTTRAKLPALRNNIVTGQGKYFDIIVSPDKFSEQTNNQNFGQELQNFGGVSCYISYVFPVWPEKATSLMPSTDSSENLLIEINCTKQGAMREHFPIMDY
jgi:hypothetical protein